jgi:xanthine dehydrogenase accessory factor
LKGVWRTDKVEAVGADRPQETAGLQQNLMRPISEIEDLSLSQIYRQLLTLIESGRPCALATLVSTSGSSPQNAGAKVLFLPDGRIIGTIGGGCMEAEARRVGLDCLRKQTPKLFQLRLDDDFGWDDGLICGGTVNIFINPYPERSKEAYAAALETAERREKAALCTVVEGDEALVGTTSLLKASGEGLEALREAAASALEAGREKLVRLEDGRAVYVEPILPRPTALIAGAGHIGAALAQILSLCGFEVVVVDDRPSFANTDRLPFADRVVVDDIPRFVREFPVNEDTYVVVVTRGHRHDAHVLRECIHSNAKYIGMIGSKRKIVVIFEEMLREGLASREELLRVHSPMGLALGDREVGEIAVSIAAEIIAVRNGVDLDAIKPMQYTPPFLME